VEDYGGKSDGMILKERVSEDEGGLVRSDVLFSFLCAEFVDLLVLYVIMLYMNGFSA